MGNAYMLQVMIFLDRTPNAYEAKIKKKFQVELHKTKFLHLKGDKSEGITFRIGKNIYQLFI